MARPYKAFRRFISFLLTIPIMFLNSQELSAKEDKNNDVKDKDLVCEEASDGMLSCSDQIKYSEVGNHIVVSRDDLELLKEIKRIRNITIDQSEEPDLEQKKECVKLLYRSKILQTTPTVPTKTVHTTPTPPPGLKSRMGRDTKNEYLKNIANEIINKKNEKKE